jgi:hypothetical protein
VVAVWDGSYQGFVQCKHIPGPVCDVGLVMGRVVHQNQKPHDYTWCLGRAGGGC